MKDTIVHYKHQVGGRNDREPLRVSVGDAKALVARYPQWYEWNPNTSQEEKRKDDDE